MLGEINEYTTHFSSLGIYTRSNPLLDNYKVIKMTASQQAKSIGLKSLKQVSDLTGQSMQTLDNWSKHKPELFKIVLIGCHRDLYNRSAN